MSSDHPTSLSLLQRLRDRDEEAWRRVNFLYGPLVNAWLEQAGVRGADAEDVRQEVFAAAAKSLPSFHRDRPGDTFRGWLRGIARNKLRDHHRRRAQEPAAEGGTDAQLRLHQLAAAEEPNESADADEVSQLYHRALELVRGEFEGRTWRMFWRVAVENRTPAEVADEMGVSPAAVRQAKSRVLRRLKEEASELIR